MRLLGLVLSIGLADSLNPTTVGPALYLASGEAGRRSVIQFTVGVFVVYFLGGAILAVGPGQLLLQFVPRPSPAVTNTIQIAAGAGLIGAATLLWHHRGGLAGRDLPDVSKRGRSSAMLGASITALEFPTAFPYFTVIAALIGSGMGPARQLALLLVFNLCFVLPLIGVVVVLSTAGEGAERILGRARRSLEVRWPHVLATLLMLAGVFVLALGVTGLGGRVHGSVGRVSRHIHHILRP